MCRTHVFNEVNSDIKINMGRISYIIHVLINLPSDVRPLLMKVMNIEIKKNKTKL